MKEADAGRSRENPNKNTLTGRLQLETAQYALSQTGLEPAAQTAISNTLELHDMVLLYFKDKLTPEGLQAGPILTFDKKSAARIKNNLIKSLKIVEENDSSPPDKVEESHALREFLSDE